MVCKLTCSVLKVELAGFRVVRGRNFCWKLFIFSLLSVSAFVALLPLFLTRTWSFGAAEEQCEEWTLEKLEKFYVDDDDWEYDDNAVNHLFPQHSNNVASLCVSVFCLLGWYFLSPHNTALAEDLDRSCKTAI